MKRTSEIDFNMFSWLKGRTAEHLVGIDFTINALLTSLLKVSLQKTILYHKTWQILLGAPVEVWYGFYVYWHIKLHELFNGKAIFVEWEQGYHFTHSCGDKGAHDFENGIRKWT